MTSDKQIEANRRNSQKSTGPITPEGKRQSSGNALSHGGFAKTILLPGEDEAEFERLLQAFMHLHDPQNPAEERYVREICVYWWKIDRLAKAEQGLLTDMVHIEAARREYKLVPNTAVSADDAATRHAVDEFFLTNGLDILPIEQDLSQALKRSLTDIPRAQVCANIVSTNQFLLRGIKRAEAGLDALRGRRLVIEGANTKRVKE